MLFYFFFFYIVSSTTEAKETTFPYIISILHTNDQHGHLIPRHDIRMFPLPVQVGGAAHRAALINSIRKGLHPTILLDAGDIAQGTPVSNYFYGKPVIESMNYMKYDAMVVGNHEFDWGVSALALMIKAASFPVLSANVINLSTNKLLPGTVSYIIKTVGDLKLGIIGLTTADTPYLTKEENTIGYKFLSPNEVVKPLIKELKNKGVDLIILLTHLGVDEDKKLAGEVKGIDVIVGGHSHTPLFKGVQVKGMQEGATIIVQAGSYGNYVGLLKLYLDSSKKIRRWRSQLIPVKKDLLSEDQNVVKIMRPYQEKIAPIMSEIIGSAKHNLMRSYSKESSLGNLICDILRESLKAEIAFYNSGGIRGDLQKGEITAGDVFTVLPFDNQAVVIELTGSAILDILEHSVSGNQGIMQCSGVTVKYDSTRPKGERILEVKVGNDALNYKHIYRVVTNDFIANGGDQYLTFKYIKERHYEILVRDIVSKYIRINSPMSAKIEGRIIDVASQTITPQTAAPQNKAIKEEKKHQELKKKELELIK